MGNDLAKLRAAFRDVRSGRWKQPQEIPLWDGRAGERVADALAAWLGTYSNATNAVLVGR